MFLMNEVRSAAVAGQFYPDQVNRLESLLSEQLAPLPDTAALPAALIVPHAGLVYSGHTAGRAYRLLHPNCEKVKRVALFGPGHRVYLEGMAVPTSHWFATPLGRIAIDHDALTTLQSLPLVQASDQAHALEHSLEVQLPFLQSVLTDFSLAPVVVGPTPATEVAAAMASLLQPGTLLVISTDLSHFHDYDRAREVDSLTAERIRNFDDQIVGQMACGCHALNGLMHLARQRRWQIEQLELCNSGDTAGDRRRVVGYGAFALYDNA
jgi:AmmeMemoRadiSam system protein B